MPEIPIHGEVGIRLANKYETLNNNDYYLGVLTPDAVNVNGFANKNIRWTAHLRSKDLNEWRSNLKNFYHENKSKYNESFLLGYVTHVLTDIIFDEDFYLNIRKKMLNKKIPLEETHLLMRDDMNRYSSNSKCYYDYIEKLKRINTFYDINNIDKKMLKEWLNIKVNNKLEVKKSLFIDKENIATLTNKVEEELKYYL